MLIRLRKLARLKQADRWLLIRSACLVLVMRVGLWILPFRWMRGLADRAVRNAPRHRIQSPPPVVHVIGAIELVARFIPGATCLTQALAARILLARHGITTTLKIGVARETDRRVKAHAWVECDGEIVIGGNVQGMKDFKPLPQI